MTTTIRRRVPVAVLALIVVFAGACGSSKSSGGSKGTSGGGAKLPATTLKGSGSSFQDAFDQEVFRDFTNDEQPNVTVNYNPTGSGQGQTDLQGGLVDFAGSDSLVKAADVSKFKGAFLYIPIASAPITISYNVSGVDKLTLSASTIAKIFSSKITTWDAAGDQGRQPRRDPAVDADRRRAPQRRLGHDRQLHEVPHRGGAERLDPRHRQGRELGEQHHRRREEHRRGREDQGHRRRHRLRRLLRREAGRA